MPTLYDKLDDVVNVTAADGWETQTNNGRERSETSGILLHWDAIKGEPTPGYYLYRNRYGGQYLGKPLRVDVRLR